MSGRGDVTGEGAHNSGVAEGASVVAKDGAAKDRRDDGWEKGCYGDRIQRALANHGKESPESEGHQKSHCSPRGSGGKGDEAAENEGGSGKKADLKAFAEEGGEVFSGLKLGERGS